MSVNPPPRCERGNMAEGGHYYNGEWLQIQTNACLFASPFSSDPDDFSVTREVRSSGCTFGGGTDYVLGSSFAVDEYV